jgi:hypothetical protein
MILGYTETLHKPLTSYKAYGQKGTLTNE